MPSVDLAVVVVVVLGAAAFLVRRLVVAGRPKEQVARLGGRLAAAMAKRPDT